MTVLEVPKHKEEIPQFLLGTTLRVADREPKSVFGFIGNEVAACGIFVTSCYFRIGHEEEDVFVVNGVSFDGVHAQWVGQVDDIAVERLEDKGYIFKAGPKPALILYL
jgi:hypothetical protein